MRFTASRGLPKLALLLAATGVGFAAHAAVPQSISLSAFSTDANKVAALKKGFAVMQSRNNASPTSTDFRTSFAYWANTHGYFGTGKFATNMTAYINYRMPQCLQVMTQAQCNTYYAHMVNTTVPADGVTDNIWGTCQHGNLNFLPWHRLYLNFFEKTLRKATGDNNFALPYWRYYDNYQSAAKGIALPPIVTPANNNSLYDQWRTAGLNASTDLMDPDSASATAAFQFNDFINFSNTLQGQPHGAMHCAVGSGCTAPDIGFVPIAGLDPVFYMHHKNIDRLWQCWLTKKAAGQPINLAWAKANLGMPDSWYNTAYTFMDENGSPVTMTIADVFDPNKIEVNYDSLVNCDAGPRPNLKIPVDKIPETKPSFPFPRHPPLRSIKEITLGIKPVTVDLQRTAAPAQGVKAESGPAQTYLTLNNVKVQGSPALTYKVFVVNKKDPKKASYVSTISLFNAGHHHGAHEGDPNRLGSFVFQVSQNLTDIGVKDVNDATVRFEPTSLMVKGTVRQKAGNGLTVESVSLETSARPPVVK